MEVGLDIISNVYTTKRTVAKPIRVQEVKSLSGKISYFSILEAYLNLPDKVSRSTIKRY